MLRQAEVDGQDVRMHLNELQGLMSPGFVLELVDSGRRLRMTLRPDYRHSSLGDKWSWEAPVVMPLVPR